MLQHAFIVGGSSGIGLAAARQLHALDFKITIAGRDRTRLEFAKTQLPGGIEAITMDAADPTQVREVIAALPPIDHLILAMGSGQGGGPFATVDIVSVRRGFEQKVLPHFAVAQAALPKLKQDGSITFLSAVSAHAAMPGTAGLGAANAAVEALVPILASELRPLRVNAVSPGVIDTPWWNFLSTEERANVFANYAGKTLVGRVGVPEDVAKAISFLVTNTFMTGHILICDGGIRLAA